MYAAIHGQAGLRAGAGIEQHAGAAADLRAIQQIDGDLPAAGAADLDCCSLRAMQRTVADLCRGRGALFTNHRQGAAVCAAGLDAGIQQSGAGARMDLHTRSGIAADPHSTSLQRQRTGFARQRIA
jgi:hypothetical protein